MFQLSLYYKNNKFQCHEDNLAFFKRYLEGKYYKHKSYLRLRTMCLFDEYSFMKRLQQKPLRNLLDYASYTATCFFCDYFHGPFNQYS